MALYYDLPVLKDIYQFVLKIFERIKDFLREYKNTLGQDMKRDAIQSVTSIYRANKLKDKELQWVTKYKNNSRFSSKFKGCNPPQFR